MENNLKAYDIWMAKLPLKKGSHIQGGYRPVIIVSNDACNTHSPIITVVPLTTKRKKQHLPTHVLLKDTGLPRWSTALCEQLMLIDNSILRKKVGCVCTEAELDALRKAICFQLGLQNNKQRSTQMMEMEMNELEGSYVLDAMQQLSLSGDCFTDPRSLIRRCGNVPEEVVARDLEELTALGYLSLDKSRLYLTPNLYAEVNASGHIARRMKDNSCPWPAALELDDLGLNEKQIKAVDMALTHQLSMVLGGPGTGKTTLIKGILQAYFDLYGSGVLLLAPTGKAASNLRIRTGCNAFTVQSALTSVPSPGLPAVSNWSRIKLIIVDEASMLTTPMLSGIFDHCQEDCRIVLVGDPNQLMSVGAGKVLSDLMELGVPSVTLQQIHRQTDEDCALRRNIQDFPSLTRASQLLFDDSFRFIEVEDPGVADITVQEAAQRHRNGEDVQILSSVNTAGDTSAEALNKVLHPLANPYPDGTPYLSNHVACFWNGDRVLVTQNMKSMGCHNGDFATLRMYPGERGCTVAALDLENGTIGYILNRVELAALRHGYAITVHKAQGSEFDTVILPVTWRMRHMLHRNLLNTAISRARKQVLLIGSWEALDYAMRTPAPERNSALVERTNELLYA